MSAIRKLSIVDCPQRDGEPIRELVTGDGKHLIFGHDGHGCAAWSYLPHTPTAYESAIIARSQSRRTKNGVRAEPWSFEESLRDLAAANKPRRVTVPEPLHSNTPAAAHAAEDWFNGPECAAILAQPVEPCTENPFAGDREPSEIDA